MRRAGFTSALRKPVRRHELVEQLLRARRPEPAARVETAPAQSGTPKLGLNVLLAEDNPINQRVAVRMLEKIGCTATVVKDGVEATIAFGRQPFDVVLMDCQMPGMNGLEATRAIRDSERRDMRERTPIVALTANAMHSDREACFAAGMDDFLPKPVRLESLTEALARVTGGERPAGSCDQ